MAAAGTELKVILMVADGVGDRPIRSLSGRTPLEAARTPTLDRLATDGATGLLHVIAPGVPPGSDTGHLSLFGYDPHKCYTGRGPFEALGAGLDLQPADVAFRGNFATVQQLKNKTFKVVDRRAGRSLPEAPALTALIDGLSLPKAPKVQVIVRHTVEHRCVIVLRGANLSVHVGDTDPHTHGDIVLTSKPLDRTPSARQTAGLVNTLTQEFYRILSATPINAKRRQAGLPEANIVLLRGAGGLPSIPPLRGIYGIRTACVAGGALYKGVARSVGMDVINVPGATGSYDTDVDAKARATAKALATHDFVFVHFKATDSAAHDKDPAKKVAMVEKVDHLLSVLTSQVNRDEIYIAVTGDHTTACDLGNHTGDPVPLLIAGPGVRSDNVTRFTERACAAGGLGHLHGRDLMPLLMNYVERTPMFGA
jgi:2,3-bisphosphoglycerate-independent phosphoglycerate mutase